MITKLELQNFQIHKNLSLDFTQGINLICGETGVGKSSVLRALSWIFFNEPRGDVVRKIGTKNTSVKVTLDNGVQVERIKSTATNAYIIYINGEEKRYDSIGKDIPEEVLKVLKIRPIVVDNIKLNLNIANQIALPFLLDKPPTFRSKLFNYLTGSDVVDKALQSLNKDLLYVNRETKIEEKNIEEKEKQLEKLTKEKTKMESIYNKASKIFVVLKEKQEKLNKLKDGLEKLDNVRNEIKQTNSNLKKIRLIDNQAIIDLNNKINKLENYSQLLDKIQTNTLELENTNKKINQLKMPKIGIQDLKLKVDKLNKLNELKSKLDNIQELREKIILNIVKTKTMLENGNIEYKELLKKLAKCPLCKSNITKEILSQIKI